MSRLKGRVAVVTDAASGMGRCAAVRLDNKGANSEVEKKWLKSFVSSTTTP